MNIILWFPDEFKQLLNYQALIKEFDDRNQKLLTDNGFSKKGGKVNRLYEMDVLFSNEDILKGLQDDNWDQVNENLIQAWKIFEKIEWDFLKTAIKKHQEKLNK